MAFHPYATTDELAGMDTLDAAPVEDLPETQPQFIPTVVSGPDDDVLTLADEPVPGTPGFGSVPELPRCAGTGCTAPTAQANFLSVSGDVSLDYALDAMLRASPEAAPRASTILQRLRKS